MRFLTKILVKNHRNYHLPHPTLTQ